MKLNSRNKQAITKEDVPQDLLDLMDIVEDLPANYADNIKPKLDRVVEFTRRRRRILNFIQEALGQLRLDMKYLMFDLDATRRERDEYKKALDGEV